MPAPGPGTRPTKGPGARREDLGDEILDLKKALNSARQDLQLEKVLVMVVLVLVCPGGCFNWVAGQVKSRRLEGSSGKRKLLKEEVKEEVEMPSRAHLTFRYLLNQNLG